MAHHCDAVHGSAPKLVILLRQSLIFSLELRDSALEVPYAIQVGLDSELDLRLQPLCAVILKLAHGDHFGSLLI